MRRETPEGGDGEPDDEASGDGESGGCAIHRGPMGRGEGGSRGSVLVLLAVLGWMMRRRVG